MLPRLEKDAEALISALERYYALLFELQEACYQLLMAEEPLNFRGPAEKAGINLDGRRDVGRKTLQISERHRIPFYSLDGPALDRQRAATVSKEGQLRKNGIRQGTKIGRLWQQRRRLEECILKAELDAVLIMARRASNRDVESTFIPDPTVAIRAMKNDVREVLCDCCRVSRVLHLTGDDRRIFCNGQRSSKSLLMRILGKPRRPQWKRHLAREEEVSKAKSKGVPLYRSFLPCTEDMTKEQHAFFRKWKCEWTKGAAIDVAAQTDYVICYVQQMLKPPWRRAAEELLKVSDAYPDASYTCRGWASDCFVMEQAYAEALRVLPEAPLASCSSMLADNRMSLKFVLGQEADAGDLLLLEGPQVTSWGREHLREIVGEMNIIIRHRRANSGCNLLEEWTPKTWNRTYSVFCGSPVSAKAKIQGYAFSRERFVLEAVRLLTRESEDMLRDKRGLPRIGEGWVSETDLFYQIKAAFPQYDVIQHARPEWLSPQHLDVFVPEISVAIEYQGVQHDQPVAFFGGKRGFEASKKRDARKRKLCKANGVRLICVRSGYRLQDLLEDIREGI